MLESVIVEMRPGAFQEHRVGVVVRKSVPLKCLFSVQLIEGGTSEHDISLLRLNNIFTVQ